MKIFLKDGRVVIYNDANNIKIEDGFVKVLDEKGGWIAMLNQELIERIDCLSPCSIKRRKNRCSK